jgi:hypothetical protein
MAGCKMCGGSEEGLGLAALWSVLTCSGQGSGGSDEDDVPDDGINYARISERYDIVFRDRHDFRSVGGRSEAADVVKMSGCLTKAAMDRPVLPMSSAMLDAFLAKIEKRPPDALETEYTHDPAAFPLSEGEVAYMRDRFIRWRDAVPGRPPTVRELFNLYVVLDRIWKPVFEEKSTALAGWSHASPPRWKGEALSIDELLADLWSGHVLLYGELTPTHTNLAPILFDLIVIFGAATDLSTGDAAADGAVRVDVVVGSASASSSSSAAESGAVTAPTTSRVQPPDRFQWTRNFQLVYRSLVWLLREQVTPWTKRTSDSWHRTGTTETA